MKLILSVLMALVPVIGGDIQAQVTFSVQEPQAMKDLTGKVIKNYQLVAFQVCSTDGQSFSAGRVYQAASQFYEWQTPGLAAARIATTVNRNIGYYLIEIGKVLTISATALTASGAIHASQGVISGLAQAHMVTDELDRFITGQIPNPAPLYQLLLKEETVFQFSGPGGCDAGVIVVRYDKRNTGHSVDLITL